MFLPRPSWDRDDNREVGKALLIVGGTVVLTQLIEWGFEALREKIKKPEKTKDEADKSSK